MPTRAFRGLRICAARSRSPAPKGRERSRTFAPTWTAPLRREWPRRSCVAAWTSSPSSGSLSSFGRTRRSSEIRVGSRRAGARRRRATCALHPATLVAPSTPPTVCAAPAPLPSPWGRARGTTSRRALRVRHCRSASEKTSVERSFSRPRQFRFVPPQFRAVCSAAFPDTKSASCSAPGVADFLVLPPRNVGLESVPRAHLRVHARRPTMAMTAEEVRYPDIYLEASVPVQRRSPEKSERGDPSFARYFDIRGGSSGETRGQGQSASTSGATALAAQVKELQVRCIRFHADERWLVRRRLAFQPTPFSSIYFPACSTDVLHAPDPPERALTVSSQTPKTVKQAKLTEKTNELEAIKVRAPPRRLRSTPYACATPPLALSFTSAGLVFPRTDR
jgi:hypothetical protein